MEGSSWFQWAAAEDACSGRDSPHGLEFGRRRLVRPDEALSRPGNEELTYRWLG